MSNVDPIRPEEIAQLQPYNRHGDKGLFLDDGLNLIIHPNGNFTMIIDSAMLRVLVDVSDAGYSSVAAECKLYREGERRPYADFFSGYNEKCLDRLYWTGAWPSNEFIVHVVNNFWQIRQDVLGGKWEE